MTAEIAILNKSAVALAADSKVTIGGGQKTFDTVNKVFTLSKVHPVGLMIFGNAEFMDYPWETIVKMYREQKSDRSEPTVDRWGRDFRRFLAAFGDIRPSDREENLENVLSAWFYEMRRMSVLDAYERGILVPSDSFTEIVRRMLERQLERARAAKGLFQNSYVERVKEEYQNAIGRVINTFFGGFEDEPLTEMAHAFVTAAIGKRISSPVSSGFVIAGFGDDQVFPALLHYETDGYLGEKLKIFRERDRTVSRDMRSSIFPFAQKEMVQRFMNGIDPEYATYLHNSFAKMLVENCFAVLDKYGLKAAKTNKVKEAITEAIVESWRKHVQSCGQFQRKKFSRPITDMVAVLPKDELPHLAESLVALTSLKRHVSDDVETVGGPIDVALISKGDGFIWIKRKHYFKAELNPGFSKNYLRNMGRGDNDGWQASSPKSIGRSPNRPDGGGTS